MDSLAGCELGEMAGIIGEPALPGKPDAVGFLPLGRSNLQGDGWVF